MEAWEMHKKACEEVSKKLKNYHGDYYREEVHTTVDPATYDEAKKAGDTHGMVSNKLADYYSDKRAMDVRSLSREYAGLSIVEIQSGVNHYKDLLHSAKKVKDHLYEEEEKRIRKEYSSTVGGLTGSKLEDEVFKHLSSYHGEEYEEAVSEFERVRKQYTAYCNAKDMYIEDNKELIEAERAKAKHEELLSSGILEELGIIPSEE